MVTPQKTALMPTAAQRDGAKPVRFPNRHPNVAPTKKLGTISPPLKPAPRVNAVRTILKKNAQVSVEPCMDEAIMSIPVPL